MEEAVALTSIMKEWGVNLADVSAGGNSPLQRVEGIGPGFQVPFSERIRREAGIPTGAVGLITEPRVADEIIQTGKADLVLMGRELVRNPMFALQAAEALGHRIPWAGAYECARPPVPS